MDLEAILNSVVSELSTPVVGTPVGLYLRVSEDKAQRANADEWREVGEQVSEQLKALMQRAGTLGEPVTVIRVYNDNNTPATDPFLVRQGFEALLSDLESGLIRGVLFWHADRFARMDYDAGRVNRIFLMHPDYIGQSLLGGTDLSTDEGRAWFTMQATMGGMEVSGLKRRTTTTNAARAQKANYQHGGRRPFGWNEDRETLSSQEASLLREAILSIPGGKLIGEIRQEWIAQGYAPKRNKGSESRHSLSHSTVEQRIINPRNCGYKAYLAQADRRETGRPWMPDYVVYKDGEPVIGNWETVCTPEEWAAAVEVLEERKRKLKEGRKKPHDTTSKYLLSGIARCGLCNFPLMMNPYAKGTNSYERYKYRYACLTILGGCGSITRVGPPVEKLVTDLLFEKVKEQIGNAPKDEPEVNEEVGAGRLEEIQNELTEVNARWKAKRISSGRALDMIEELEAERAALGKKRRQQLARQVQRDTEQPNLPEEWEGFTTGQRRQRLRQEIRAVIVHPVGRGKRFDPDAIEIVWQE